MQSSYGTIFDTSPEAVLGPTIFKNERGIPFHCLKSPLDYFPFQKFMVDLLRGMGNVVYQDVAISVYVFTSILAKDEAELLDSLVTWVRKLKVILCGTA